MNWRHCGSTVFIEESRCQNKEGKNMSGKQQLNCFEAAEGSWLRECNCIKHVNNGGFLVPTEGAIILVLLCIICTKTYKL